jgi:hypothetical protein
MDCFEEHSHDTPSTPRFFAMAVQWPQVACTCRALARKACTKRVFHTSRNGRNGSAMAARAAQWPQGLLSACTQDNTSKLICNNMHMKRRKHTNNQHNYNPLK